MPKWISMIIIGGFAVGLTIWFASPYSAVHGIEKAMAINNANALSEHVDYDALRANLKLRFSSYLSESSNPNMPGIFKQAISTQLSGIIGAAVDVYVTPDMLDRVMQGRGLGVEGNTSPNPQSTSKSWNLRWWTKRTGLNEVVLHVASNNPEYDGREVQVYLRRVSGLTWKIVDVDPASWKDWTLKRFQAGPSGKG